MNARDKQIGGTHYANRLIQPVDYAEANGFGYCESLVLRYITRHKEKDGAKDLLKAIHTLELLLEKHYGVKHD